MVTFKHEYTIPPTNNMLTDFDVHEPVANLDSSHGVLEQEPRSNQLWESFVLGYALDRNQAEAMRPIVEAEGSFITSREFMHSFEAAGLAQSPRSVTRALEKLRSKGTFLRTERIDNKLMYALDQDALALHRQAVDTRNIQRVKVQELLDGGVLDYFKQKIALSQADEVTKQQYTIYLQHLYENAGWPQALTGITSGDQSKRSTVDLIGGLRRVLPDGVIASNGTVRPSTYWYDHQALQRIPKDYTDESVAGIVQDIETIEERFAGVRYKHKIRSVFASYVLAHLEQGSGVILRQQLIDSLRRDGMYDRRHLLVNALRALTQHQLVEVYPTAQSVYGEVRLSGDFDIDAYDVYKGAAKLISQQKKEVLREAEESTVEVYTPQIKTTTPEKEWQYDSKLAPEEQALREGLEFAIPTANPQILQDIYNILRAHNGRIRLDVLGSYGFNTQSITGYIRQEQATFDQPVFLVSDDCVRLAPRLRSSRHSVVFTKN